MKIAIIELGGSHLEVVYSFSHLLKMKGCEIHFICNERIEKQLSDKSVADAIVSVPDKFGTFGQFKTLRFIKKYLKQHNIQTVVINTTEIRIIRNLLFFIRKLNTTGVVHNAAKLERKATLTRINFSLIKKMLVLGQNIYKNLHPAANYKINYFSAIYFPEVKKLSPVKKAGEFWVMIPGGVEQGRRDYLGFLDGIENAAFPGNLKIIILGNLNPQRSPEIYEKIQRSPVKDSIVTFDSFVDYHTFHSYLRQSDIILPLFKLDGTDSYLNKRMSGTVNLGIGYKVPFFTPDIYNAHTDIKDYSVFYDSYKDLSRQIIETVNDKNKLEQIRLRYDNSPLHKDVENEAQKLFDFITS